MTTIFAKDEIEKLICPKEIIQELENGFISYSHNKATIAPVSSLHFTAPPADVHIKSGGIEGEELYVVKVASGFYDNPKQGLPSSNGLMLLFSRKTGELKAILLDEGRLTDLRTGLAGAIAAKYLASPSISSIGIIGTGVQAKEQLNNLRFATTCKNVMIWGRDLQKAALFLKDPLFAHLSIRVAPTIEHLTGECNLIVTTTCATTPLLFSHHIQPGTHITAVGADQKGKQELDVSVFEKADMIAVDSLLQCSEYGDYAHAKHLGRTPIELGTLIAQPILDRPKSAITIADLTGVAVQDVQIAKAVYAKFCRQSSGP